MITTMPSMAPKPVWSISHPLLTPAEPRATKASVAPSRYRVQTRVQRKPLRTPTWVKMSKSPATTVSWMTSPTIEITTDRRETGLRFTNDYNQAELIERGLYVVLMQDDGWTVA